MDIETITETIRQSLDPGSVLPSLDCITSLRGRLGGHLWLLLEEDLGEMDVPLRALRRQAEALLAVDTPSASRGAGWEHVRMLATITRDLLARYRRVHGC